MSSSENSIASLEGDADLLRRVTGLSAVVRTESNSVSADFCLQNQEGDFALARVVHDGLLFSVAKPSRQRRMGIPYKK